MEHNFTLLKSIYGKVPYDMDFKKGEIGHVSNSITIVDTRNYQITIIATENFFFIIDSNEKFKRSTNINDVYDTIITWFNNNAKKHNTSASA